MNTEELKNLLIGLLREQITSNSYRTDSYGRRDTNEPLNRLMRDLIEALQL